MSVPGRMRVTERWRERDSSVCANTGTVHSCTVVLVSERNRSECLSNLVYYIYINTSLFSTFYFFIKIERPVLASNFWKGKNENRNKIMNILVSCVCVCVCVDAKTTHSYIKIPGIKQNIIQVVYYNGNQK